MTNMTFCKKIDWFLAKGKQDFVEHEMNFLTEFEIEKNEK